MTASDTIPTPGGPGRRPDEGGSVTTTRTRGFRAALAAMLWISAAAPAAAAAAPAPSPLVAATERFAFWSDLEVNLHYFLYQWASGEGEAQRLAKAFGGSWPEGVVRIDVAAYANDLGAYSTEAAAGPAPHVVVSSGDDSYAGTAAIEMVFHEAGHSDTLIGAASGPLDAAVEAAGATGAPRDLWHALLFYTAGELAREALAAAGVPDYRPYAEANGLWPRARGWAAARAALDAHWRPYLAAGGGPGRDEALAAVARALAEHPAG
jgi:hypothetical protein